ncbi:hypothetical protein QWY31_06170 [Cytophagales bacterium LB-30]|uniref:Nuclear transport factor 2 family protein n=1 Tax=Shiella aurantiaca TaxID=3058365 RepID=A0ABT8F3Y0_9BACT|nr:hypothetical protein [Shiella aurantiaca]MDN4165079.1 hypothetical protein [Shiella aurantiaca]
MKKIIFLLLFTPLASMAQSPYAADVQSEDAILKAIYEVISGSPEEPRDWERFRYLFAEGATLNPTLLTPEGKVKHIQWTPDQYVEMFTTQRKNIGFYEKEVNRVSEAYGNIYHAFSTYAIRESLDGPVVRRGINSFQLIKTEERWYILSILWSNETEKDPIPDKYAGK